MKTNLYDSFCLIYNVLYLIFFAVVLFKFRINLELKFDLCTSADVS